MFGGGEKVEAEEGLFLPTAVKVRLKVPKRKSQPTDGFTVDG